MSTNLRDEQFANLQGAQEKVLDLINRHEFIRCLERAGYRGAKWSQVRARSRMSGRWT